MKIISQGIANQNPGINNLHNAKKSREMSGAAAKTADYDKITIGASGSPGLSDERFIVSLKKSLMAEIHAGAPEQKVNDLKQQVAAREYDINPAEIAKRMMLENHEAKYE